MVVDKLSETRVGGRMRVGQSWNAMFGRKRTRVEDVVLLLI